MNSVYLTLILRLLGFLRTSDLFAVQRAALERLLPPKLIETIWFLVEVLEPLDVSGPAKANMLRAKLDQPLYGVADQVAVADNNTINLAIETAVAEMRGKQA